MKPNISGSAYVRQSDGTRRNTARVMTSCVVCGKQRLRLTHQLSVWSGKCKACRSSEMGRSNTKIELRCCTCKIVKDASEFGVNRKSCSGLQYECKSCLSQRTKRFHKTARIETINHYTNGENRCACCGEELYEFLGIDHINGDGAKHRRENPSAKNLPVWLKQNGWPDGFRVLCHNCNFARGHYGYCPHERLRDGAGK